jgi:hypothetical protein
MSTSGYGYWRADPVRENSRGRKVRLCSDLCRGERFSPFRSERPRDVQPAEELAVLVVGLPQLAVEKVREGEKGCQPEVGAESECREEPNLEVAERGPVEDRLPAAKVVVAELLGGEADATPELPFLGVLPLSVRGRDASVPSSRKKDPAASPGSCTGGRNPPR